MSRVIDFGKRARIINRTVSKEDNRKILMELNQNKIFFSIRETAELLNVSYDFVSAKIRTGKIKATRFGSRPLVHIDELAKIMSEGV